MVAGPRRRVGAAAAAQSAVPHARPRETEETRIAHTRKKIAHAHERGP